MTYQNYNGTGPLTDEDLVSIIDQEKAELTTEGLGILEQQRSQSNLAYQGEFSAGITHSSMSSIIIDPVKPAVDTHTAFVANPFTRKDAISMSPTNPMMKPVAEQVNKLVNYCLHRMDHCGMSGQELIKEWIKSAALNKNGIWKVTWDATPMHQIKEMRDVSPEEVDAYIFSLEQQGYEVEVIEEKIEMTEVAQTTQIGNPQEGPGGMEQYSVASTDYTGSMLSLIHI